MIARAVAPPQVQESLGMRLDPSLYDATPPPDSDALPFVAVSTRVIGVTKTSVDADGDDEQPAIVDVVTYQVLAHPVCCCLLTVAVIHQWKFYTLPQLQQLVDNGQLMSQLPESHPRIEGSTSEFSPNMLGSLIPDDEEM